MHCLCCDRLLSDYESVLRHPVTNDFLDICQTCLKDIPIEPVVPKHFIDEDYSEAEDVDL